MKLALYFSKAGILIVYILNLLVRHEVVCADPFKSRQPVLSGFLTTLSIESATEALKSAARFSFIRAISESLFSLFTDSPCLILSAEFLGGTQQFSKIYCKLKIYLWKLLLCRRAL